MPPVAGIERRLAHEPVHSGLGTQPPIRVVPVHLDGRALDARHFARALVDDFHAKATRIGPSHVHAQQHRGPILRLGAAGARLNVDESSARIHLAREHSRELELTHPHFERTRVLHDLRESGRVVLRLDERQQLRSIREADAFKTIHARWRRLGYPFDSLVSSYATAIGSSADRPAALAELMGILVNDGMRMPTHKIGALHFAVGTPFETRVVQSSARPERVLAPQVAATVRTALLSVVEGGTARRLGTQLKLADGSTLPFGGKTGTGDNRFEVFAPGGRLVSSRTVSRAGTFVFMLGDRYFGTVSAYVVGEEAQKFRFTSALPVQLLKALTPVLARNLGNACIFAPGETYMTRKPVPPLTAQKIAAVQTREAGH